MSRNLFGDDPTGGDDRGTPHKLREPCKRCCCEDGYILTKSGQDVVRCASCGKALYNAPKTETGRKARTVTTVHNGIKPKQRARILMRANGCCEICHASDVPLHVGHWVSVKQGLEQGLTDVELNDDANLLAMCEECNLGIGRETVPLRLVIAALMARLRNAKTEGE